MKHAALILLVLVVLLVLLGSLTTLSVAGIAVGMPGQIDAHNGFVHWSSSLTERNVDLRVSTLPTMWGEKVVMRILDQKKSY